MYALFALHYYKIFWITRTRREFVGVFDNYNDACGYAFNVLGMDNSNAFNVVCISKAEQAAHTRSLLGGC